ncbi:hypothetical protein [Actinomycetospora soli]|uniref:hypothetical protein n=1 Tax=Actinomycetospora soli TaxID=2893887 RepID=UPI001E4ED948|nr:hypothetical protein [Actinomycetospora soli]MCD2191637.1 hypothetical protein [Actinomycetospora soli]
MYRLYGRRVALEWRGAVLGVATAVTVAVLARIAPSISFQWLFAVSGAVIVLSASVLLGLAFLRPITLPPVPAQFTEREIAELQPLVLRGEPVDPPELQAAAVGQARHGLRLAHLQFAWLSILGCFWSLRLGGTGPLILFAYAGIALAVFGVGGLVRSGVVQARLDRLEDAAEARV